MFFLKYRCDDKRFKGCDICSSVEEEFDLHWNFRGTWPTLRDDIPKMHSLDSFSERRQME